MCEIISLEFWAHVFEVLTPLVLFSWFLYSERQKNKRDYFQELPGRFGGWVENTLGKSTDEKHERFEGGLILRIIDIDSNGYFRGQAAYFENKITMYPEQPDRRAERSRIYGTSTEFIGHSEYSWHPSRKRNPLIQQENRTYSGKIFFVNRLDAFSKSEQSKNQSIYKFKHYREKGTIEFTLLQAGKEKFPSIFSVDKSFLHSLDPFNNIMIVFEDHLSENTKKLFS